MGRNGPPGLTDSEADRVRGVMRELLSTKFKNNRTELARKLGLSQPAVSQQLGDPTQGRTPKNRPAEKTARIVAKLAGKADGFWRDDFTPAEPTESASVRDLTLARERAKLVTISRRFVLRIDSVRLLAEPDSKEGVMMDGLPEHIRRAALALAHLENRDIAEVIVAAERAVLDLGADYGGQDAEGWLSPIRKRLNSGSGTRRIAKGVQSPDTRVK